MASMEEAVEDYKSSLSDLTFNSKPLINMLTMLAEENTQYASNIAHIIEERLLKAKSTHLLPTLYLMDSIIKNAPGSKYPQLFQQNIVSSFCLVFEQVDEKTRQSMFKLRQTWSEIFNSKKLYALDIRVNQIDPAWPITAPPQIDPTPASIHVNPKFLNKSQENMEAQKQKQKELQEQQAAREEEEKRKKEEEETAKRAQEEQEALMRQQLLAKQQELLKLQQQRLELELAETRQRLEQQAKSMQEREIQMKTVKKEPEEITQPVPMATDVGHRDPRMRDPRLTGRDPRMASAQTSVLTSTSHTASVAATTAQAVIAPYSHTKPTAVPVAPVQTTKPAAASPSPASVATSQPLPSSAASSVVKSESYRRTKSPQKSTSKTKDKQSPAKTIKKEDQSKEDSEKKSEDKSRPSTASKSSSRNDSKSSASSSSSSQSKKDDKDHKSGSSSRKSRYDKRSSRESAADSSDNREKRMNTRSMRSHRKNDQELEASRSRSRSPRNRSPRSESQESERMERRRTRQSVQKKSDLNGGAKDRKSDRKSAEKQNVSASDSKNKHRKNDADERMDNDIDFRKRHGTHSDIAHPPNKRPKNEDATVEEKPKLDDDISQLFGTEDQDYRRMPPPPLSVTPPDHRHDRYGDSLPLRSPNHPGWATFKASRPEEFPVERRLSLEMPPPSSRLFDDHRLSSPQTRDVPPMQPPPLPPQVLRDLNIKSTEDRELNIPSQLQLSSAEDILTQADIQLRAGKITHDQHQLLLKQLTELYKLQKLKKELHLKEQKQKQQYESMQQAAKDDMAYTQHSQKLKKTINVPPPPGRKQVSPPRSTAPPIPQEQKPVVPSLLDMDIKPVNSSFKKESVEPVKVGKVSSRGRVHQDTDIRKKDNPIKRSAGNSLPMLPKMRSMNEQQSLLPQMKPTVQHLPHLPPQHIPPQHLPPQHLPPKEEPVEKLLPPTPQPPPTPPPTPQQPVEYSARKDPRWMGLKSQRDPELVSEIVIDNRAYEFRLMRPDPRKIRIGNTTRLVSADTATGEILIDGKVYYKIGQPPRDIFLSGRKYRFFYQGPPKNIWIDGQIFDVRVDAPPKLIEISGEKYEISLDSKLNEILIGGLFAGPIEGMGSQVQLGKEMHDLQHEPPARKILIDSKLCELKFDGTVPVIIIEGLEHGIRFDGPPREILINDKPHLVHMDKPTKIKIGLRPYEIAFGGPGHEVIINSKWYEVKFNGPVREVTVGGRLIKMCLKGAPPDVKIMEPLVPEERTICPFEGQGPPGPMQMGPPFEMRPLMPGEPERILNPANIPPHEMRRQGDTEENETVDDEDVRTSQKIHSGFGIGNMADLLGISQGNEEMDKDKPQPENDLKIKSEQNPNVQNQQNIRGPHPFRGPHEAGAKQRPGEAFPQNHPQDPSLQMDNPGIRQMGPPQRFPNQPQQFPNQRQPFQGEPRDNFQPVRGQFNPNQAQAGMQGVNQGRQGQMQRFPNQPQGQFQNQPQQMQRFPNQQDPAWNQSQNMPMQQNGRMFMPNQGPRGPQDPRMQGPGPQGHVHQGQGQMNQGQGHQGPMLHGPGQQGRMPQGPGLQGPRPGQGYGVQGYQQQQQAWNQVFTPHQQPRLMQMGGPLQQQAPASSSAPLVSRLPSQVDVNDLFSKLLTAGIIGGAKPSEPQPLQHHQQQTLPPQSNAVVSGMSAAAVPSTSPLMTAIASAVSSKPNPASAGVSNSLMSITAKLKEFAQVEKVEKVEKEDPIPDLKDLETNKLKKCYRGPIQKLYSGIQCSSCGVRFSAENTERYREHLDWHFRQNKRDKEEMKVTKFRKWYYDLSDWVQFEEISDVEERAQSAIFEKLLQGAGGAAAAEPSATASALDAVDEDVIRCPAASGSGDDVCFICHDPFEQYWDEEEEEWHLKDAVKVADKTYHPVCYEDAKETSMLDSSLLETPTPTPSVEKTEPFFRPGSQAAATAVKTETQEQQPEVKPEPISLHQEENGKTRSEPSNQSSRSKSSVSNDKQSESSSIMDTNMIVQVKEERIEDNKTTACVQKESVPADQESSSRKESVTVNQEQISTGVSDKKTETPSVKDVYTPQAKEDVKMETDIDEKDMTLEQLESKMSLSF